MPYLVRGEKHKYPTNKNLVRFFTHNKKYYLEAASKRLGSVSMSPNDELQTQTSLSSFYYFFLNSLNESDANVLPILNESVTSPSVVHQFMKLVAKLINQLSPDLFSLLLSSYSGIS